MRKKILFEIICLGGLIYFLAVVSGEVTSGSKAGAVSRFWLALVVMPIFVFHIIRDLRKYLKAKSTSNDNNEFMGESADSAR